MTKTSVRKTDVVPIEQYPRWRLLPPEIVYIIMKMLGTDRVSLSACALAARDFTFAALCCLGRHIAVNTGARLRECADLVTRGSAFLHVRSLDLGITKKRDIRQRDWDNYIIILDFFARRRTLTRLWLSEVSFSCRKQSETVRNIITSLIATVNELGLYSCRFSSRAEMISLIRAFPLCTSLYVRDCVARNPPGADMFTKLPQHTLHISDLELTSSSGRRFLIDVSTLIKDAALDISPLAGFSCDMTTADAARHTVMSAMASPIERFQLICDEPEGFHVLADPALTKWPLKSLTIGPLVQKDSRWCDRAVQLSPNLPNLETVTMLGCYRTPLQFDLREFWRSIDRLLSREGSFPRLERLDICITIGSQRLRYPYRRRVVQCLPTLHIARKVYFWGERF